MRRNLPVTQQNHDFPDDATLMSVTDAQSHITYANAAFIAISGFDRGELIGQPHNLVRHPDMPTQAFADMWATLKAGQSWTALVKNRRKNGDHYWVRANAAPVVRQGRLMGYMSVRTKPQASEIAAAEALYRDFREGHAGRRSFHKGLVVRTGLWAWSSALQTLPARWRIRLGLLPIPFVPGLAAGLAGGVERDALMLIVGSAVAVTLAAAFWLENQLARPLQRVLRQALAVAAGNPEQGLHMDRVDEIGMIQRAVNQAGLNLRSLVDDVSAQATGVSTASVEIAQGNNDLSTRTEQTASNLEQTAASIEELTATVKTNADTAGQATQLAAAATAAATRGGEVVSRVVGTMDDITASSKRIHDIIGVIDGIAFQTNILALNAAVEAARAGEQGRGFAVVAAEVRTLAQRSAQAAREIKSLIGDSVQKVESGSRLANDAGRTMGDIVNQVRHVSDLITEISHATIEQSSGIGQVNVAVGHLDQMTQQNAALVEQSAAAAEGLKSQANRLAEAIGVFRSQRAA